MDWFQFDEDMRELFRRFEQQPEDADLLESICYGLNIRSFHNECVDYARKGLAKFPNHPGLFYELIIASSLDTANVLGAILTDLEKIYEQDPSDESVRRNLALTRYFLEQDEEAESLLMTILDDHHEVERETYEVLAQLEYTRQDMEQCIFYCDKAIDRPGPSARVVRLKGLCYQELDDLEKARNCFLVALEQEPNFVWACHSLGSLFLVSQDFAQAFRFLGKASYINPGDPGNLFLVAEAFMDMDAYDLAAAELEKLLLCKPEKRIEAEVHNALGYIEIRQGAYDTAKDHLSMAIELEPELAVAYFNMGQIADLEGSQALAEHHYKLALEYDPMHVEAWVELGFIYLDQKNWEKASDCFTETLELEPYEASAYLGLSKVSHKRKDYDAQLRHAQAAIGYDADNPDVNNNLGIAFECNKEYLEAEGAYSRALALDPMHSQAANNLGYLYEKMMTLFPDQEQAYKEKAIQAWVLRLQICAYLKKSVKGAITHLRKLGLAQDQIDTFAEQPFMPVHQDEEVDGA